MGPPKEQKPSQDTMPQDDVVAFTCCMPRRRWQHEPTDDSWRASNKSEAVSVVGSLPSASSLNRSRRRRRYRLRWGNGTGTESSSLASSRSFTSPMHAKTAKDTSSVSSSVSSLGGGRVVSGESNSTIRTHDNDFDSNHRDHHKHHHHHHGHKHHHRERQSPTSKPTLHEERTMLRQRKQLKQQRKFQQRWNPQKGGVHDTNEEPKEHKGEMRDGDSMNLDASHQHSSRKSLGSASDCSLELDGDSDTDTVGSSSSNLNADSDAMSDADTVLEDEGWPRRAVLLITAPPREVAARVVAVYVYFATFRRRYRNQDLPGVRLKSTFHYYGGVNGYALASIIVAASIYCREPMILHTITVLLVLAIIERIAAWSIYLANCRDTRQFMEISTWMTRFWLKQANLAAEGDTVRQAAVATSAGFWTIAGKSATMYLWRWHSRSVARRNRQEANSHMTFLDKCYDIAKRSGAVAEPGERRRFMWQQDM